MESIIIYALLQSTGNTATRPEKYPNVFFRASVTYVPYPHEAIPRGLSHRKLSLRRVSHKRVALRRTSHSRMSHSRMSHKHVT
jgi:hypothetical protein